MAMDHYRGKRNKKERREEAKEDPKRTRMITIGGIAFVVVAIICLLIANAVNRSGDHTGEALTPSGASVQKGRDYQDVVEDFEENGFTNIKTDPLEDLITGWMTKDGEVETVSVGGDEDYSPDQWVPEDTEVVISYHTFSNTEDDKQTETVETKELEEPEEKTDSTDSSEQTSSPTENNTNSTKSSNSGNTSKSNNSTKATKGTQESLEEKLGVSYAWAAMEMRGKEEYPYGFTLHYVTGILAEKAEDENTWFLKAKCTYTNAFGAETDGNCEARVTGTSDNPEITYFVVY